MVTNSSEYFKTYMEKNKTKIRQQMKEAQKAYDIRQFVKKLNDNGYKRFPYSKIKKYNIMKNEDGLYYIQNT